MSHENVEVVRRAIDGFVSAGYDVQKVEDFIELSDPGIEYDISRTNPETRLYRGRDGVIEAFRQWLATWEDFAVQALDPIDAGGVGGDPFARLFPCTVVEADFFCPVSPPSGPVIERYVGAPWPGGSFGSA